MSEDRTIYGNYSLKDLEIKNCTKAFYNALSDLSLAKNNIRKVMDRFKCKKSFDEVITREVKKL